MGGLRLRHVSGGRCALIPFCYPTPRNFTETYVAWGWRSRLTAPAARSQSNASSARMIAGRSSIPMAFRPGGGQHLADHQPGADGRGDVRPRACRERRLGELSDLAVLRRAQDRHRADRSANRKPLGAGEAACAAVGAALANAVHDATGVRLRTVPFTPERVKAALTKA